jgi:hypothetical protein
MEFTIPQFIEKEMKIAGPLTIKQLAYLGTAGGICFFLFMTKAMPFPAWVALSIVLMGIAGALAFLKIKGTTLPVFIKNLIMFSFGPKIYIWRKRQSPAITITKIGREPQVNKDDEEKSELKASGRSKLNNLSSFIEITGR